MSEEDLAFIKRFVLASGSLKTVAKAYRVSYPTIRLRLDRLIGKIEVADEAEEVSEFERVAKAQYADGKIDFETLKLFLTVYRKEVEDRHAASDD